MPPFNYDLDRFDVLKDEMLSKEVTMTPCGTFHYVLQSDGSRTGGVYYTHFRIVGKEETRVYKRSFLVHKHNVYVAEWCRRHIHFIELDEVRKEQRNYCSKPCPLVVQSGRHLVVSQEELEWEQAASKQCLSLEDQLEHLARLEAEGKLITGFCSKENGSTFDPGHIPVSLFGHPFVPGSIDCPKQTKNSHLHPTDLYCLISPHYLPFRQMEQSWNVEHWKLPLKTRITSFIPGHRINVK